MEQQHKQLLFSAALRQEEYKQQVREQERLKSTAPTHAAPPLKQQQQQQQAEGQAHPAAVLPPRKQPQLPQGCLLQLPQAKQQRQQPLQREPQHSQRRAVSSGSPPGPSPIRPVAEGPIREDNCQHKGVFCLLSTPEDSGNKALQKESPAPPSWTFTRAARACSSSSSSKCKDASRSGRYAAGVRGQAAASTGAARVAAAVTSAAAAARLRSRERQRPQLASRSSLRPQNSEQHLQQKQRSLNALGRPLRESSQVCLQSRLLLRLQTAQQQSQQQQRQQHQMLRQRCSWSVASFLPLRKEAAEGLLSLRARSLAAAPQQQQQLPSLQRPLSFQEELLLLRRLWEANHAVSTAAQRQVTQRSQQQQRQHRQQQTDVVDTLLLQQVLEERTAESTRAKRQLLLLRQLQHQKTKLELLRRQQQSCSRKLTQKLAPAALRWWRSNSSSSSSGNAGAERSGKGPPECLLTGILEGPHLPLEGELWLRRLHWELNFEIRQWQQQQSSGSGSSRTSNKQVVTLLQLIKKKCVKRRRKKETQLRRQAVSSFHKASRQMTLWASSSSSSSSSRSWFTLHAHHRVVSISGSGEVRIFSSSAASWQQQNAVVEPFELFFDTCSSSDGSEELQQPQQQQSKAQNKQRKKQLHRLLLRQWSLRKPRASEAETAPALAAPAETAVAAATTAKPESAHCNSGQLHGCSGPLPATFDILHTSEDRGSKLTAASAAAKASPAFSEGVEHLNAAFFTGLQLFAAANCFLWLLCRGASLLQLRLYLRRGSRQQLLQEQQQQQQRLRQMLLDERCLALDRHGTSADAALLAWRGAQLAHEIFVRQQHVQQQQQQRERQEQQQKQLQQQPPQQQEWQQPQDCFLVEPGTDRTPPGSSSTSSSKKTPDCNTQYLGEKPERGSCCSGCSRCCSRSVGKSGGHPRRSSRSLSYDFPRKHRLPLSSLRSLPVGSSSSFWSHRRRSSCQRSSSDSNFCRGSSSNADNVLPPYVRSLPDAGKACARLDALQVERAWSSKSFSSNNGCSDSSSSPCCCHRSNCSSSSSSSSSSRCGCGNEGCDREGVLNKSASFKDVLRLPINWARRLTNMGKKESYRRGAVATAASHKLPPLQQQQNRPPADELGLSADSCSSGLQHQVPDAELQHQQKVSTGLHEEAQQQQQPEQQQQQQQQHSRQQQQQTATTERTCEDAALSLLKATFELHRAGPHTQGLLLPQAGADGGPQGPLSCPRGPPADAAALLLDLDDIAGAFGQETPPHVEGPQGGSCEKTQFGSPGGPPQQPRQGAPQGPLGPPGAPQGPLGAPQEGWRWGAPGTFSGAQELQQQMLSRGSPAEGALRDPAAAAAAAAAAEERFNCRADWASAAAETLRGVCTPHADSPGGGGEPTSASESRGTAAAAAAAAAATAAAAARAGTQEAGGPPFWLFGAVLDARESLGEGGEWELLVTDGLGVFAAAAAAEAAAAVVQQVQQTSLVPPLPQLERLRNAQGHFLLQVKGEDPKNQTVHILAFRAKAPREEVKEKLNFLLALLAGEQQQQILNK
ncbi:hypothetical protein, conserved [Eimeria tenella]|uniref:Uncharacterized protein n=1 Tax=Eimeria tenella TaxID=5802 RepID=U6KSF7_EIMTE|nr:hypothetical protein, conserved [Eimeria tenella]CDJ38333.1 hypothetical protein, conserved [Eimeria tenella]|eukprot:XP_013229171.1 hypothetical protein, conserved [Eimeria tenella]